MGSKWGSSVRKKRGFTLFEFSVFSHFHFFSVIFVFEMNYAPFNRSSLIFPTLFPCFPVEPDLYPPAFPALLCVCGLQSFHGGSDRVTDFVPALFFLGRSDSFSFRTCPPVLPPKVEPLPWADSWRAGPAFIAHFPPPPFLSPFPFRKFPRNPENGDDRSNKAGSRSDWFSIVLFPPRPVVQASPAPQSPQAP